MSNVELNSTQNPTHELWPTKHLYTGEKFAQYHCKNHDKGISVAQTLEHLIP